ILGEVKGKKIGSLRCRGLKPPVIKGHTAAFRYWFEAFGHSGPYSENVEIREGKQTLIPSGNPMNALAVKETNKQLVKRAKRPTTKDTKKGRVPYEPKRAPPFTIEELQGMRNYCLKSYEGIRGLWLWNVIIFSFALFLRSEEPLRLKMKHISLPKSFSVESGKLPRRLEVRIPWSKADRKAKGVTLTLWSNPINPQLCPVKALFSWFLITGIKKGFIFPRVSRNNMKVIAGSARGVTYYRKWFSEMCKNRFGKHYTTHSIRRSAAKWAARCGADDSTIKRAGR
ncbi:uncharacterized protein LOC114574910, partial [Exaiptasia diaphana]|uniref:Tyr recombinase domain-containing protein n=1 Tax=Exaiptasia diaphana TaxID=2652724 RepID=A0A913YH70_EXADI